MPSRSKKQKTPTPVDSIHHKEKRANIPTNELRDFVAEDEKCPKDILYPRDPTLDPQLVWKGKDQQDAEDLAVPCVPVYIQEKIHPHALIENLRDTAAAGEPEPELQLFDDFNGIGTFEKKVDFYHWPMNWSNRMILGDSLLVMTSLAEKEGLKGKVQMVYLDPPYGIQFKSNWQVSTRRPNVKDGKVEDTTREPEQIRAFRDTWKLGIHSYLAYWRDRLMAIRNLLTETGSLFIQIGDENVHRVRCIMDEVFGEDNFIAQIYFVTTSGRQEANVDRIGNYVLWYAKNQGYVKSRKLYLPKSEDITDTESAGDLQSQEIRATGSYGVDFRGTTFHPAAGNHWKPKQDGMRRLIAADRVVQLRTVLRFRRYRSDFPVKILPDVWTDTSGGAGPSKIYVVQTNPRIIERCILMSTDPGDLVLDPTCGSGTTAHIAEQWGRRWITMDTSRVALALARTRLMSGRYLYYLLADSSEGVQKEAEIIGIIPQQQQTGADIRKGFVYKRVPHITLECIGHNEEIDVIYTKWQGKLEPIRAKLNKTLSHKWEEWQIPREADEKWSTEAKHLHAEWWKLRQERQKEMDDSIARHADTELLYDQPYEDSKRVRVTGPFTVESLSPHRMLSSDDSLPESERTGKETNGANQFETMIIENLRKAGVQNTVRKQRLGFTRLESFPGKWLQAHGEYSEGETPKRVAICIGPEHGTVDGDLIKEAAKEALEGRGFDLLLICGFAFDPHASETAKEFAPERLAGNAATVSRGKTAKKETLGSGNGNRRKQSNEFATAEAMRQYGKLPVLLVRMNADLSLGEKFLKRTGAGNLFMIFGEPDIELRHLDDGKLQVEIHGLDVYDPTTGEIRSHTTDDIACWFIDTNYDGESFFVRHAYFTGAGDPYEKLKRALKAEIDEAAWATLYSTVSRPFVPPTTGKIAIKVINHYGDEVLKVYEI